MLRLLLIFAVFTTLSTACSTTTVYIVRHAEKVSEDDATDLSPAGKQRALALADTLANVRIDSIFTTPYPRTRQTAMPLAQRKNLQLFDYPASPTTTIVNRLRAIRNKTVLVVGHSNTILEITRGFGAQPTMKRIESSDFDNLFRVTLRRSLFGRSVLLRETTYGRPTLP